jgi:hypothetical protein
MLEPALTVHCDKDGRWRRFLFLLVGHGYALGVSCLDSLPNLVSTPQPLLPLAGSDAP